MRTPVRRRPSAGPRVSQSTPSRKGPDVSAAPHRPSASRIVRLAGRAGAGVLALALAGCGAGFSAQTYQERTVSDGNNAAVGAIAIRNIAILPGDGGMVAAGSAAMVRMTLANNGAQDDALVSAASPAAASVDITGGTSGGTVTSLPLPRLGSTGNSAGLVLRGVKQQLISGSTVPVTLRFQRNGEITVDVPVATTGQYDESRPRSSNFHEPGQGEKAAG